MLIHQVLSTDKRISGVTWYTGRGFPLRGRRLSISGVLIQCGVLVC